MRVVITGSAAEHIADGYWFYEDQSEGLGVRFRTEILDQVRRLSRTAGIHQLHFEKYFRALSAKFPYAIYYNILGETVQVYAVLDCRRDPEWIAKQLM